MKNLKNIIEYVLWFHELEISIKLKTLVKINSMILPTNYVSSDGEREIRAHAEKLRIKANVRLKIHKPNSLTTSPSTFKSWNRKHYDDAKTIAKIVKIW